MGGDPERGDRHGQRMDPTASTESPTGEPPPRTDFDQATQPFRRELVAYCYRIVGSGQDAEDLVQETYLRAWRAYASFEGRASLRSWLYKIATNACLTWVEARKTRVLPSGLAAACDGPPRAPRPSHLDDAAWLEPLADGWSSLAADDPATIVLSRQSLRLALIASLQYLPAAQRAIFVLREVLSFSAPEAAEILGTTIAAIKSGLQRARARLDGLTVDPEDLLEPSDARAQELLAGYVAAFERADASLLLQVLRADATLEATPFGDWQAGRVNCIRLLDDYVLGAPGQWRMLATTANGQPAAAIYERSPEGGLRASGIVVLSATPTGISRVVAFHHDPALVERFGFPATLAR
jgi:RNA polymerase sigma-70 factor (ECF subfamily)